MAPQKGKEGTKGQKQIIEENAETLIFYRNMAWGANAFYLGVMFIFFDMFTATNIILFLISSASYIGSYQFMVYIGKQRSSTHEVNNTFEDKLAYSKPTTYTSLWAIDLNDKDGLAEHLKDMIILTAASQLLSLISNYFWLLLLLAPARGFYFLWVKILSPYFFQQAPPQEIDEKKQRKLERKMKRQH